jgi:hypothetical protein
MQWQLIAGPLLRQIVQWLSGVTLGVGVMTDGDVATVVGAVSSLANIGLVIRARIKAGN